MGTAIQRERLQRGWTSAELNRRLRREAERLELPTATESSLRVEISKWENGDRRPDARYRVLLQEVFGLSPAALDLDEPTEDSAEGAVALAEPIRRDARRRHVTSELVEYFERQLLDHARMDNLVGPGLVVSTAELQLRQLDELTPGGPPELSRLTSRYAEFLGWLLQDTGRPADALRQTDRAIDLAEAAGDERLAAYNVMRKSNILLGLREGERTRAVASRAVTLAERVAPDLLPVCLRQLALSEAQLSNERYARDAVEQALALTVPSMTTAGLSSYCTTSYVQMEAALCLLTLGRPADAERSCVDALRQWPRDLVRDESLCLARLAVARCERHAVDGACEAAMAAIDRIHAAPSARALHMVRVAAHKLRPFARNSAVRELTQALAEVA